MNFLSNVGRRVGEWIGGNRLKSVPSGAAPSATPAPGGIAARYLEAIDQSTQASPRHPFLTQLEIGRLEEGREATPGQLLLPGASISWRHCVITQTAEGRCFVRDLSRNGTRVNGRRLVPNMETEFGLGDTLDLGPGLQFVLAGDQARVAAPPPPPHKRTDVAPHLTIATVLVGDIRDYTVLVRKAPADELQQSVNRVFEALTASVLAQGGTVKEFPGDAILSFWEGDLRGRQAVAACRAAIVLDQLVRQIAADPSIWALKDFPLQMDWALATGDVSIDSFGGDTPIGLSMVGEPIVLACRLEKFANDQTGRVLLCRMTRQMAAKGLLRSDGEPLTFQDLGPMHAKGFDYPDNVFALQVPES